MPYTKSYDLDTDTTLGGDNASDYVAASQKAIKNYVDNHSGGGGANTDLSNLTATGEAHFLKNTATGTNSLTVGGLSTTNGNSTNIGIGSAVNGDGSIAIGNGAVASAPYKAIQLGTGVNSTSFTFNVGFGYAEDQTTQINYQLLDGNTGYIPNERLLGLLQTIYPVGCVYLTTNSTCPLSALFGTWSLVSSGRALWTGAGSNGNTIISAGLPNPTGKFGSFRAGNSPTKEGAFASSTTSSTSSAGHSSSSGTIATLIFDASNSSSIYGRSATVQPPAYVVNVFRRTA